MICLKQLEDRRHSTLSGGEAFRGGQSSAGSSGPSADSASVAQQRAVGVARRAGRNQPKKKKKGERKTARIGSRRVIRLGLWQTVRKEFVRKGRGQEKEKARTSWCTGSRAEHVSTWRHTTLAIEIFLFGGVRSRRRG